MRLQSVESRLVAPPLTGAFGPDEVVDLPDPVRRYLLGAIAPGTPLSTSAWVRMTGRIKLQRWLRFRAREMLSPRRGFVWAARVAGAISGYDRYADGEGAQRWALFGLIPVARAEGPDVTRSAAARGAAEALWLPTTLLPRCDVAWTAKDDHHITAEHMLDDVKVEMRFTLDDDARPRSVVFDRWGDPDGEGRFGWHPFGGVFTRYATFAGLTIPSAGRMGWYPGTDRWADGEFFRYNITDVSPVIAG